jgi:hypothetical protein
MIIKRDMAVDSLTKVCEESLKLIKELIEADNAVYGKGFEDGVAAQAKVQHTLKPWVELTEDEAIELLPVGDWEIESTLEFARAVQSKLKEKNT